MPEEELQQAPAVDDANGEADIDDLDEVDDGPLDAKLGKLDDRLNSAVGELMDQNKQVESYLDFLAEERRKELQGTDANQLTLADALPDESESAAEPTDSTTAT